MKFIQETGAIISPDADILHIVDGHPGYVDFPAETILELHRQSPGIVWALSHTHPDGMSGLSSTDVGTLKAWARALYPFPVRMITITQVDTYIVPHVLETRYLALLESKESWLARNKETPRKIDILVEDVSERQLNINTRLNKSNWYGLFLAERSYE